MSHSKCRSKCCPPIVLSSPPRTSHGAQLSTNITQVLNPGTSINPLIEAPAQFSNSAFLNTNIASGSINVTTTSVYQVTGYVGVFLVPGASSVEILTLTLLVNGIATPALLPFQIRPAGLPGNTSYFYLQVQGLVPLTAGDVVTLSVNRLNNGPINNVAVNYANLQILE